MAGKREGGREGEREGGGDGGREAEREGGRKAGREAGRERERERARARASERPQHDRSMTNTQDALASTGLVAMCMTYEEEDTFLPAGVDKHASKHWASSPKKKRMR